MTTKNLERLAWALGAVVAVMTAFLVITSCNSEMIVDPTGNSDGRVKLEIKAIVPDATTRLNGTEFTEFSVAKGEQFSVMVGEGDDTDGYTKAYDEVYTVGEAGKFTTDEPYYFKNEDPVKVIGVYPADMANKNYGTVAAPLSNSMPTDWGSDFTFTIGSLQTYDGVYLANDLQITEPVTASFDSPQAALVFKHRLSRIEFTWTYDAATSYYWLYVDNVLPTAQFHALTGESRDPYGATGTATSITVEDGERGNNAYCIIPPQTISKGTQFVRLEIGNYCENHYTAKLPQDVEFKSGHTYTLCLNFVDDAELEISSVSVTPWIDEDDPLDLNLFPAE